LHHGKGEAIFVCERIILCAPISEAEHLLRDVAVKVKRLNCNVGSLQAAFQETPEVLDSLSVDLPANVLVEMVAKINPQLFAGN
jgi:hypothetical protein